MDETGGKPSLEVPAHKARLDGHADSNSADWEGLSDEALAQWAQQAPGAFDALVRRHAPKVFRLASSVVGAGAADDVVQEVLLSVHAHLHSFRGQARLSTWLHRVTLNACHAALRKRQSQPLEQHPEPLLARSDPAHASETLQLREVLAWAMQQLPEAQREVVALRELSGLDYTEIADITGVEVGTVKSRLFRARAALRELLAQCWDVLP